VFYFIEDAPLLCVLEDFLPKLDQFFIEQESNLDFTPDVDTSVREAVRDEERAPEGRDKVTENTVKEEAETAKDEESDEVFTAEGEEVKSKGEARSLSSVDEDYVSALEMYCLLKQRLSDVRHHWRLVLKEALSDHGQHTGSMYT
jgi:hypothetical protein